MTVFYVDPIGGNDANAGTSFATRWQSLTSGATAARIAPGDEIRVIASPDPTSMGQNATFTDGSQTITLTTAVTADISQSTGGWTASTNVTTSTSNGRKISATSASIAINATFTTGKAAYLALGSSQDFSAYQQVSFWIKMSSGSMTADGDITLRLCSDTAGNTTVNTISVPRIRATGTWQPVTVDTSAALGSAIQSIALYVEQDRGAQTFLINNVLACKASSAADSLTLTSLIGKNTGDEPWIPICNISGTSVFIESSPGDTNAVASYYSGTTETVTCYKREPLVLPSSVQNSAATNSTWGGIVDSGTSSNLITYSGGWDTTDMSTQPGSTYISGANGLGYGIAYTGSYNSVDKINLTRFGPSVVLSGNATHNTFTARDICNMGNLLNSGGSILISNSSGQYIYSNTINITNVQHSSSAGIYYANSGFAYLNTITIVNLNSNKQTSINTSTAITTGDTINITNCNRNGVGDTAAQTMAGAILSGFQSCNVGFENIMNNRGAGLIIIYSSNNTVSITGTVSGNNTYGGAFANLQIGLGSAGSYQASSSNNKIILSGATLTCNTSTFNVLCDTIASTNNVFIEGTYTSPATQIVCSYGDITLLNPTFSGVGQIAAVGNIGDVKTASVSIGNYNEGTTDQRVYFRGVTNTPASLISITSDTSIRHTASGISWKMTNENTNFPLTLPVAKVACNSGALVTANVWVYRTSTSLTTKFVCPGGQILGVTSDVSTSASAAINTWEQLTITFTPTQQGVVELQVQCYGAAASVYVDDFSVSQA